MNYFDILLAQKTGYIPHNYFDALFARKIGGAVLKDFPGLPSSIVTVTDALAKPLDSLKVAITPVQSGSGDPSPDNIRPISGWTGMNVVRNNKNIFNPSLIKTGKWVSAISSSTRVLGQEYSDGAWKCSDYCEVKPLTTYTITTPHYQPATAAGLVYFSSNTEDSAISGVTTNEQGSATFTFTTPANCKYMRFSWINDSSSESYPYPQLELGSSKTAYEPYTEQDYPITFPSEAGTVYGGTLDVETGVLTVDRKQLNTSNTNWSMYHGVFYTTSSSIQTNPSVRPIAEQYITMANADGLGTTSGWSNYSIRQNTSGSSIYIKDSRFSSASDFKNNANVNFVFSLATPKTYQLTPTEVQMLLGTNNIWADTGDILEGKYWGKRSSATRAMLNTLRDAGEITEITPEEPEENADER